MDVRMLGTRDAAPAIDPRATFEERRRDRYARRSVRRARDEAREVVLALMALAMPLALCWAYSVMHCAGMLP